MLTALKNLLFAAHLVMRNKTADPSRKAVRDDKIFNHLQPCHSELSFMGEESAVPYTTLITAAGCVILARDERAAVDLPGCARQVE
jgi:hypothetical protein